MPELRSRAPGSRPLSVRTWKPLHTPSTGTPRFAAASWGIEIISLDSGRIWYAHDAQRLLVPASSAKLYTAALALDSLGADYRFATSLLASARPLRDGTLRGDLTLYGRGDPTLGTEMHARWAEELAEARATAKARGCRSDRR